LRLAIQNLDQSDSEKLIYPSQDIRIPYDALLQRPSCYYTHL
ncbi:Phospholipase A I, partial [Fusarium oxysporum f. sp. albedinis]